MRIQIICMLTFVLFLQRADGVTPTYDSVRQGYALRVQLMNNSTFGRVAFPPFQPNPNPPPDSIGVEYPTGVEHVYGGGLWVGGRLDTTQSGTGPRLKLVTTGYEGWAGPYFEWFPGESSADTFWQVLGRGVPKPAGWDGYWGTSLPYKPVADQNYHCTYTDTAVAVSQHVPLHLKVIQSSFAWNEPEPLLVLEYRIINTGRRMIDSAYVGWFVDIDIGPTGPPYYWQRNYVGYYSDLHMPYAHNPIDPGSTPFGLKLIRTSLPLDSIIYTFDWYAGPQSPSPDVARYDRMSSGIIRPDEYPTISDARFLFAFGPFSLRPSTELNPDTVVVAAAFVSGTSLSAMRRNAIHADSLYRALLTSVRSTGSMVPEQFTLYQNYPNPFNPSTTIEFDLPLAAFTNLRVYDVLGREVAVLADELLTSGRYRRTWDAINFSSGVYYVRLTAGDFSAVRKLVLVR